MSTISLLREVVKDTRVDTKENLTNVLPKPINADKVVWSRSFYGLVET